MGIKKYTYEYVKEYIEGFGYKLISESYKNNNTSLKLICPKGHECNISFANFKNKNRRCSICYGNKKLTTEKVSIKLKNEGYTLLNEYTNANSKIIVKCPNNHIWETKWSKFNSGRRCPYCSGKFNSYETIKELIEQEKGYKLISNNCNQLRDRILIKCNNNHIYETTVNNFKLNRRCPYCKETSGELKIKNFLESKNLKFIQQFKFPDCKFKTELAFDFYLPDINTIIEYDGEFHYNIIIDIDTFVNGKIRDTVKNIYCKNKNINIIRIPYWDFENIESILINKLIKLK